MARIPPPAPAVDGVRIAGVGTLAWGVAFVIALLLRSRLEADGHGWWVTTAGVGVLLGLVGIAFVRRYQRTITTR